MYYGHGRALIRIAYAEDDLTLNELLGNYFDSLESCKVMLRATNGKDLLEGIKYTPEIDLIVTDIRMPGMDGYELARRVKKEHPEIKILFTSVYHNELVYCQLIRCGADGFIRKGATPAEYRKAIFELMNQGNYFSGFPVSLNRKKLNGYGKKHSLESLITDEELQFLKNVGSDKTYDAIAADMGISGRHGEYIRQSLFEKFDVRNRVELALFAYKGGVYS
jgi:DNA-binding NarL/FixJ family response regulator